MSNLLCYHCRYHWPTSPPKSPRLLSNAKPDMPSLCPACLQLHTTHLQTSPDPISMGQRAHGCPVHTLPVAETLNAENEQSAHSSKQVQPQQSACAHLRKELEQPFCVGTGQTDAACQTAALSGLENHKHGAANFAQKPDLLITTVALQQQIEKEGNGKPVWVSWICCWTLHCSLNLFSKSQLLEAVYF